MCARVCALLLLCLDVYFECGWLPLISVCVCECVLFVLYVASVCSYVCVGVVFVLVFALCVFLSDHVICSSNLPACL